jgi:hypothetical protein
MDPVGDKHTRTLFAFAFPIRVAFIDNSNGIDPILGCAALGAGA